MLLFVLAVAAPVGAAAEEAWYVRAQGGGNYADPESITGLLGSTFNRTSEFKSGYLAGAAVGYDFNGFRIEGEFLYRENDVEALIGGTGVVSGDRSIRTVTANFIYDFYKTEIAPDRFLGVYAGFGLGTAQVSLNGVTQGGTLLIDSDDSVFAYQAIFGVSHTLTPRLTANVDYRYLTTVGPEFVTAANESVESGVEDHSILFGLTWHFGPEPGMKSQPSAPAPVPAVTRPAERRVAEGSPAPAPRTTQTFLVFFDWDQTAVRPDAAQILAEAAAVAKQGVATVIQLTGHADRSGSRGYNQGLSERRAAAVKNFLVGQGVAANQIVTLGRGEDDPLVATPDNVREPRNRRVEIQLP
ncbi:MAG: OmpA family protein [Alphaproteobacteria bacterium]|nr:OmpA family protein [Alphaproteobacteria bacterium]